ncbi:energy transducer TonB [Tunturiibacter lichenicola]|uniref:energy transducer TonB n=1 Tax=Tunturiibacter lichenicola TaxID=2051959 RepID=UPI0021B227F9|nr:energy transducer TonB [Edaphobacter lichenicola]
MRSRLSISLAMAMLMAISAAGAITLAQEPANAPEGSSLPVGSKDRPVRVSSGVMAGLVVHKVDPANPTANMTGAVVIAATIDDHGKVIQMTAISGPEALHGAALAALRQWTYKPYLLNGVPVFVSTMVTVIFPRTR